MGVRHSQHQALRGDELALDVDGATIQRDGVDPPRGDMVLCGADVHEEDQRQEDGKTKIGEWEGSGIQEGELVPIYCEDAGRSGGSNRDGVEHEREEAGGAESNDSDEFVEKDTTMDVGVGAVSSDSPTSAGEPGGSDSHKKIPRTFRASWVRRSRRLLSAALLFFFGCPFFTPAPPTDCPFTLTDPFLLHTCAMGYAAEAGIQGGFGSPRYLVTSHDDSLTRPEKGTLRWGIETFRKGVYVTFNHSMHIRLQGRVFLRSHTTVDGGGGRRVVISGAGLVIQNKTDVILHNLEVRDQPGDHDLIPIRGSSLVWVDHCRVANAIRGTVDVVYGSTDVTVSNCHITNKNLTMLFGAADEDEYDKAMRVTVYRNWFDSCGQRQPHCRWGDCHVANNLYTNWGYYCLGGRSFARIRSEHNVFHAGGVLKRKEVTPWFGPKSTSTPNFDNSSTILSFGDLLLNGATFHEFRGTLPIFSPPYRLPLYKASAQMESFIKQSAGPMYPFWAGFL